MFFKDIFQSVRKLSKLPQIMREAHHVLNETVRVFTLYNPLHVPLKTAGIQARASLAAHEMASIENSYRPAEPEAFNVYWEKLGGLYPRIFPMYKTAFDNGLKSYQDTANIAASCSTWENEYAMLFRDYVSVYAQGRVLDVGCGPKEVPVYLRGYPVNLISGIDPLPVEGKSPFERVQGVNEYMPWPDGAFNTVINATSLDHVFCLTTALKETRRVMAKGGRFLVWLASINGAAEYKPESITAPIDKYHLFHFDQAWIDPQFERFFAIEDKMTFSVGGMDHIFYCMTA